MSNADNNNNNNKNNKYNDNNNYNNNNNNIDNNKMIIIICYFTGEARAGYPLRQLLCSSRRRRGRDGSHRSNKGVLGNQDLVIGHTKGK